MTDAPQHADTQPAPTIARTEVAPVREGEALDWDRLEQHLRQHIPELDGKLEVLQFPNGSANLTYLVSFGETRLVVRRPPFGRIAPGAHDMRREHRAVAGLSTVFDRAPRPYLFCDDHTVIGSDFLVVEYRPGVVVWDVIPESMSRHDDVARRIGYAVVEALGELHLVDPASCGLSDLGKPDGFVARQVSGWRKRWDLVDVDRVVEMRDVSERLTALCPPQSSTVSVLHNDFKIDNCQFRPDDPDRVFSIFDWDMATLGDPLVDLGTLLNYWPDPSDPSDNRALHVPGLEQMGLPTRSEIIDRYVSVTGFDVSTVAWYEAFATWKTAVVLEQLYQRWVRGESTDERMSTKGEPVARLAARATAMLDRLSTTA